MISDSEVKILTLILVQFVVGRTISVVNNLTLILMDVCKLPKVINE